MTKKPPTAEVIEGEIRGYVINDNIWYIQLNKVEHIFYQTFIIVVTDSFDTGSYSKIIFKTFCNRIVTYDINFNTTTVTNEPTLDSKCTICFENFRNQLARKLITE